MASMLLRSARDAARAAASRREASSAAPEQTPHRLTVTGDEGPSSDVVGDNSTAAAPQLPQSPDLPDGFLLGRVEFVADDKDLASDEALWALYERWCKAYGEERSHDEMLRRFGYFKETALHVDRANKKAIRAGSSARFAINKFADGKLCDHHIIVGASDSRIVWDLGELATSVRLN